MAETLQDYLLRISSLLPSPVVRAYPILQACWDFYGPQTWLLLYYPLFYLAKVAKKLSASPSEGQGLYRNFAEVGSEATTVFVFILSPLFYVLLLKYCFFESEFWKGMSEEENPHDSLDEVPDRMLHTSIDSGLSNDEVIARRKTYGLNEIGHRRNWVFVLLHLSVGPANLLLEVSTHTAERLIYH